MLFEGLPPDADMVLALEPGELGLRMLPKLSMPPTIPGAIISLQSFLAHAFAQTYFADGRVGSNSPYPTERHNEIKAAIAEAWAWLEKEGLLVPILVNMTGGGEEFHPKNRKLSRRGHKLAAEPQSAVSARLLPKEVLHPDIREDVWGLFHRGKYDTAVFEAMKAVEIAVREAANLRPTDIGVDLMRKAFNPQSGPLADQYAPAGEREARSALFAGAIGSYKNPQSHRKVDLDNPREAAEIIMLACHLLRIVTDRHSVFS